MTVPTIEEICDNRTVMEQIADLKVKKQNKLPIANEPGLVLKSTSTGVEWGTDSEGHMTATNKEV